MKHIDITQRNPKNQQPQQYGQQSIRVADNDAFAMTTRQRKEVTVKVMISEIERLKRDVDHLKLSPSWAENLLGIFAGIAVSGVFGVLALFTNRNIYVTVGTIALLAIGIVGTLLCLAFKSSFSDIEKNQKDQIKEDLDHWIGNIK